MAYAKTTFATVFSEFTDYLLPRSHNEIEITSEPTTFFHHTVTVPTGNRKTPGHVVDFSANQLNTTPTSIVVHNKSAEFSVNVSWYSKRPDLTGWESGDIYAVDPYTNSGFNAVVHQFRDNMEPETSWFENLHMGDLLIADVSDHAGIAAEEGEAPIEWVFVGFGDSSATVTNYHKIILSRPYELIVTDLTTSEQQDNSLTKFTHFTHNSHDIGAGQFLHIPGNLYESTKNELTISGITNACVVDIHALE